MSEEEITAPRHSWMPHSPCSDGCLPAKSMAVYVGLPARTLRVLRAASVVLAGVGLGAILPVLRREVRERLARGWFRGLLAALGVHLEIHGPQQFRPASSVVDGRKAQRARDGVLVVSNHSSWLDIVALNAVQPLRMVAKSEIKDWPVIGLLSRRAGTIYVDRERLSSLPKTVAELAGALRGGSVVGVFPEGTTWCGLASGRYRPAPFQAALDSGVAVRPVVLRFRRRDGQPTTLAAFVGDATLWSSLLRVAGARDLVVEVHVLPELRPGAATNRKALAAAAEQAAAVHSVVPEGYDEPHRLPRAQATAA